MKYLCAASGLKDNYAEGALWQCMERVKGIEPSF
jgi:hypothetical protein